MATGVTFESALEDVEARFLYNLPESELSQPDRLFFQIEQAWWYYEDFKADRFSHLPHFAKLQNFAKKIFEHCAILRNYVDKCEELFTDFQHYKSMIPVYGVIMLSPDMKKLVLVCSYKGNSWGFPRGKVNQNESSLNAAVREALEETGFDATAYCKEEDNLVCVEGQKIIKLYIASNVPEDAHFETQTRKEISKISFFPVDALPKGTYGVHPFMQRLNRWINQKRQRKGGGSGGKVAAIGASGGKSSSKRALGSAVGVSRGESAQFDGRNRDTFADETGAKGWAVDSMFSANAKLTGRSYAYDGNPHEFGSSHPRYVNFNERDNGAAVGVGGEGGVGVGVGGKSATTAGTSSRVTGLGAGYSGSGIKILSRDAFTAQSSGASTVVAKSNSAKWPHFSRNGPFVLDRAAVMAALDDMLAQKSSQAFVGASF